MKDDEGEKIAYHVVLAFLSISFVVLVVLLFILCKKKPSKPEESTPPVKLSASPYSLMDIDASTDGFNPNRIIGTGRTGTVYVAFLSNGDLIAVKRIHPRLVLSHAGFGFSSVVKWLSLAHHPNVVPILGFSEAPGERIIVMELEGMMSLSYNLHQSSDQGMSLLDWTRRIRIAAGAARGLEYLHEAMTPAVVHGCVKPSNILIDGRFCARVCDYGLSFLAPQERKGVVGYVDDEYWLDNKGGGGGGGGGRGGASKESDVYGLGVVLLELLSGRKNEEGLLVEWALPLIRQRRFSEILDGRLVVPSNLEPLARLAKVGLACVGNSRKNRPSIVHVATILSNLEMEPCL